MAPVPEAAVERPGGGRGAAGGTGRSPNIKIALRPMLNDNLALKLLHTQIDLALTFPELVSPDLYSETMFEDRYVAVSVREKYVAGR